MRTNKFETRGSTIFIDENGFLRVYIKKGHRIDLAEAGEMLEIYKGLMNGSKHKQIFEGGSFFSMTEEALKFAQDHSKEVFIASALIHKSVAVRLLFKFFKRFYKQNIPFEMFGNEKDAKNWLKKF